MKHPLVRMAAVICRIILPVACSPQIAASQSSVRQVPDVIVRLDRAVDSSPSPLGLTNIFFAPPSPEIQRAMRTGEGWTGIQIADVVMGKGLRTIYAARFKLPGTDQMHYVVDTAGNLDFAHAQSLTFEPWPHILVANLDLDVHTTRGAHRRIPYQVSQSDGYTYARIAEYLTGRMQVDGKDYAIKVRSAYRDEPFYTPTAGTVFLIDLDRNGEIAEKASVTLNGAPAAAEQVMARTPFMLGKKAWEVADVDSMGSRLVIRRTKTRVAAAENFKAPQIVAKTLSGRSYRLSKQSGVILVEFWSVNCGFCEKARPAANNLADAERGTSFTWLAIALENDRVEIERFLAAHPMSATVALNDSSAWATYNPTGVTPFFVVVDSKGIIRFRAAGASAIDAVAAKVKMLSPVAR